MKFSEAIRLGSMLRPNQAYFVLVNVQQNASCALGAAAEAVGILDVERNSYTGKAPKEWTHIVRRETACPVCAAVFPRLDDAIPHVNNYHWTREQIADWVATIEAQHETPQVEPQPVSVEA